MPTKSLEAGTYDVTWTLSNYDTLTARIKVESAGVTCLSVTGGNCGSTTPPGIVISGFTVTGYLKSAPAAPTTGYLKVNSSPTGATVKADGMLCGTTPVTACELSVGAYTVTITKPGYNPVTRTATISAGQTTDLGTITLTSTGGGGDVAKFGLSEIVENHLPDWISGYACLASWSDRYNCPAGYKRTGYNVVGKGGHGCCADCYVAFVKCEKEEVAPTEITKSEFLTELQSRGAIDLSKIGSSIVWNEWYYTGGYLRYRSYGVKIAIGDLATRNPPTQDSYIDFWDAKWHKIDTISRSWALAQIDKLPFVGGAPPAEMAKSEFFAELQKRGAIDTSKLPTDSGPNKWYYKNGAARYSGGGYAVNINALTYSNPPSDASFIEFLGASGYVGSLPRDWALARLNELPFVSGGGGGAPKNFDDWVAGKGGKSAIKGKDISELVDAYSGIAPLGFTVTGGNVSTAVDYYTGIG